MGKKQTELEYTYDDLNRQEVDLRILSPERLFEIADAEMLRQLGDHEDSRFERKSRSVKPKQLAEYFSMWANTPPGGLIIVGQSDKGEMEGLLGLPQRSLNDLEQAAYTYCPEATFKQKRIRCTNALGQEDFVLLYFVEYHRTRSVATSEGKYFRRVGDTKRELRKEEEIRQLRQDKNEVAVELDDVNLRYPHDFQMAAIEAFAGAVVTKGGLRTYHTTEDVLELQRLGRRCEGGFTPNVACALLFAKEVRDVIPGSRIRFLRFEGKSQGTGTKWNAIKDEFVEGTLPEQIDRGAALLRTQLRSFSRLGTGNKFYTAPEYPEEAWYEALVNACVHRTYGNGLRNMPIFVRMFDDRLEIESPGPFPPYVTAQNVYEMHCPRNPRLMNAMWYMGFVKMAHEGTRRIRDTMREMELPEPEFQQREIGDALVRVVLRNSIEHRRVWVDSDVAELLGTALAAKLDEEEKRCINFAAEHGGRISVSDAQRLTKRTWPSAKKLLEALRARNILVFEHHGGQRDPKARYVLIGFDTHRE